MIASGKLRLGIVLLLTAFVAQFGGCATWQAESPETTETLPAPRQLATDSVLLESQFVNVPTDDPDWSDRLWKELDEQHLPTDLRRRLLANGVRVGIVSSQMPEMLRNLLDEQTERQKKVGEDNGEHVGSQMMFGHQRWQALARRRNEIVTSPTRDSMVLLINDDGRLSGRSYSQAQCKLALRVYPRGDGGARMEIVPEIHHGQPKQRFVGDGASFRFDSGPDRDVLSNLRVESEISLGQTLVFTATSPPKGLGQHFFYDDPTQPTRPRMLLIRLAQSQYDSLFSEDNVNGPLATSEAY